MRKGHFIGLIASFLIAFGFLFGFYSKAFLHPNQVMMATSADGLKSYAAYAGHIENDSTYSHYDGSNYPYGQVHIYTDGQTGLASVLRLLNNMHPLFLNNAIGIYNWLALLSYAFCAVLIFLILRHFAVAPWLSVLGGISIMLLSPQIHRLGGHPTLVYAVVFPLNWWLFLKFSNTDKWAWLYSVSIGLTNAFWYFIHPYFIILNASFLLAGWAFTFWKDSLVKMNDFWVSSGTDTVIYNGFNDVQNDIFYCTGGAFTGTRLDDNWIMSKQSQILRPGKEYIASYWHYNKGDLSTQLNLNLLLSKPGKKSYEWKDQAGATGSFIIDGDWSFVELKFIAPDPGKLLSFNMRSFEKEQIRFYIDEFMIRPADSEVYQIVERNGEKYLVYNGMRIPQPLGDLD